ncbi:MAG TPA: chemotaxis-specific protein-glutamate methyltransferase CheB [Thermoanaerobaculia bacterium]|nr:chemotaxis-specific protein-glutamate methyltransferase CheB [Thermoanaerobaculia bacterium]
MRIGIVNNDRAVADSLQRIIATQPELQTAWVASDGEDAVRLCAADKPDLVLMDLAMRRVDGIEATRRIMAATPCAILIVTPTVDGDAALVFRAMGHGALDAVNTPVSGAGEEALLAKIRTIGRLVNPRRSARTTLPRIPAIGAAPPPAPPLVVIGSSTGGPKALAEILSSMSGPPRAAVVVVQHVDEQFASGLASWLTREARFPVRTILEGDRPQVGEVAIAESNDHLVLADDLSFRYVREPAELPYRPSVDVFFKNVAQVWPSPGIAVLLTGMGSDGGQGMLALRRKGWHTIAQDRATSVIYGMPKAAVDLDAAVQVLPLDEIGRAIVLQLGALRVPRMSGSMLVRP